MADATPLFPGMTEEEIQELIATSGPSEDKIKDLREKIKAQKTPEGKKADEELRKKYLGE